jgi:integrase/recombinase XerC
MNAPVLVEATLLEDYERYLATKPAHTRDAYLHDVATLRALAGEVPLAGLSSADLRRFLATLHGRGISGRSLARMLSGWRAFFRFAMDRDRSYKDDPWLKAPKAQRDSICFRPMKR